MGRDERGQPIWQRPPGWLQAFGGPPGEAEAGTAEALARKQAEWHGKTKPYGGRGGKGSRNAGGDGEARKKSHVQLLNSDDEGVPTPYNWDAPCDGQATGKRQRKGTMAFEADFRSDKQRNEQRQRDREKQQAS